MSEEHLPPPADPMPAPWDGDTIPVPNYINGKPVVAAIAVPAVEAGSPQQWMVLVHDTAEQFFIICHVGWSGGYRASNPQYGFGFFDGIEELARITGLSPDALEEEAEEPQVDSNLTVGQLHDKLGDIDARYPVAIESGAAYWTVEAVEEQIIDGKPYLVLAVGEFIASVPTDPQQP